MCISIKKIRYSSVASFMRLSHSFDPTPTEQHNDRQQKTNAKYKSHTQRYRVGVWCVFL